MKFFPIAMVALTLSLLVGCGGSSDGIKRADVSGTVTFEGTPVERGFIQFVPVPGVEGAPVKLTIENGEYSSSSDPVDSRGIPVGENRVEITASRSTGKQIKNEMGEMEDEIEWYIPEKYNTNSELTMEIAPGDNPRDFTLTP